MGGGGVTGDLLAADHDKKTVLPTRARRPKKGDKKKKEKKDKSVLGKAGDALKATFNVFMAASTVVSLALAAEAVWQLHGTQLTLSNAVPTLTKLLPLTGIGVFGAAQLVGLVARVVRVIVTLPIMLSGTWVILQNAPKVGLRSWVLGLGFGFGFGFGCSLVVKRALLLCVCGGKVAEGHAMRPFSVQRVHASSLPRGMSELDFCRGCARRTLRSCTVRMHAYLAQSNSRVCVFQRLRSYPPLCRKPNHAKPT